jgi:hypothetical protein
MVETRGAAEFLFRYMMARYLCKEGTLSPGQPDYLVREITHGRRVFDEILIFTDAGPRIIEDAKAGDFFVAVIDGEDGAMPEMDPAELAAWRKYIWEDAPLPLAEPKEPDAVMRSAGIGKHERNGDDRRAARQAAD